MQGTTQRGPLRAGGSNGDALAFSIALVGGKETVALAGGSRGGKAVIRAFVTSRVADSGARGARIAAMNAAGPSRAGVRAVAEQSIVAGLGVVAADAGKSLRWVLEAGPGGTAEFIGTNVIIVTIRICPTLAFAVVKLA